MSYYSVYLEDELAELEEGGSPDQSGPEIDWVVGPQGRGTGSLHADLWTATAADLAKRTRPKRMSSGSAIIGR